MRNIRSCFTICKNGFRKWSCNYRIYVLFLLLLIFVHHYVRPFYDVSVRVERDLPLAIFPFLTNGTMTQIIIMFGMLFLFCDAPFTDNSQLYTIIRSGKERWAVGQILYILSASALYLLVIALLSIFMLLPNVDFADKWGSIFSTLAQGGNLGNISLSIPQRIVAQYTPVEAMVTSFLLEWGAVVFLALLLFAISLHANRIVGIVSVSVLILFDTVVSTNLPYWYYKLSPVSMARLTTLDALGSQGRPTLLYAGLFYCLGILLLSAICIISVRKKAVKVEVIL